jgi:NDP-sugar pyrophosphorylase family protein
VTGFVERGSFADDARGLVNAGLYVVDPSLIARIPAGTVADFGHDVFPDALSRGEHLAIHLLPGPVLDVGTPDALMLARLNSPFGAQAH